MSPRPTRRQFLCAAAGGAGAIAASRCASESARRARLAGGQGVVVVQSAWPQSLDPSMDINVNAGNVYLHVLEAPTRYRYDEAQQRVVLEPLLCERWENLAPDRWRFVLRPGLAFSNGEKVTAEVARFSVATIKGNRGMAASLMAHVKDVEVVDELTFDIVTEGGYAATPGSAAFLVFLPPRHYAESGGKAGFGRNPVGTGPYRFVEWQEGVHITFAANPAYWGPPPRIPVLTFRAQSEMATRVALLETGEADLITGVPPELIAHVQRFAAVKTARALRRVFCFFNCFVPPTDNPLVRKAINYAIDVEALVKYVLEGHAYAAKGINKPGYVGYAPEKLEGYRYDPRRARALLETAGYPDGVDLDFNHPIGRWLNDKDVAAAITGMAAKAGIRLRQKGGEFNTVQSLYTSQQATGMNMWSSGPLWLDPSYEWQVPFWSQGLYRYSHDERMDGLLERLRQEVDPVKRVPIAQEFEKYVVDDYCPWLFLYDEEHMYGVSKTLLWNPSPLDFMQLQFAATVA
jgi:peptide/nickel transport system substrate-binding protein